jgi:hypothetical protein
MATIDFMTREDMEQFKSELFAELRRLGVGVGKRTEHKEWLKSYEVRKILGISPGTLQNLRINGTLPFSRIGGLLYYRESDIRQLLEKNNK